MLFVCLQAAQLYISEQYYYISTSSISTRCFSYAYWEHVDLIYDKHFFLIMCYI